jgi:hypothetical protein
VTAAVDLFRALYRFEGADLDLSGVRIHNKGVDDLCRAWGARALTIGADIYFRADSYAPHTRAGLRLLAHEVAHVVQQCRGPVDAIPLGDTFAVGPCDGLEEQEADAAAEAVLAGRPFVFRPPAPSAGPTAVTGRLLVQRYMAWEHLLLGNLDPAAIRATIPAAGESLGVEVINESSEHLKAQCALLEELGRNSGDVDADRLRANYPGIDTVRLSGSGIVVTLGELNILPDYLSHPADIDTAPASFAVPLVQAIRAQCYRELNRVMGQPRTSRRRWSALRYPDARAFPEIREAIEVDSLGKKCGRPAWERYSSVVSRNAAHFAPFSWYRWQTFHLLAREMITEAGAKSGEERERMRARAQVYAGYADHFLQDSFAAGHLVNKTLIMQWYVEWLTGSRTPFTDRALLATMTCQRQPLLHGPDRYDPQPGASGQRLYPGGNADPHAVTDPQSAIEAATLAARIQSSGIVGLTPAERHAGYVGYLALLGSSVGQLSAGIAHGYFNKRSLVVASHRDGPGYRIWGDRTMFADGTGAAHAAAAAHTSRQAIADLLTHGETDITSRQIFESFPNHVEVGGGLLPLRQWHDEKLRDLCFQELFGLKSTQAQRLLLDLTSRRFGVPSSDYQALRKQLA